MDEYNYRIVKTQFDGTGWQTYGSYGLGEGKFSDATGMAYNDNTADIFVLDKPDRYTNNALLIKTKIDGSSWQSYATQGVGSINDFDSMVYDNNTGYYYFAAAFNQVIRTKKDGTDWTIVGTHGDGNTPFSFGYVAGMDVDKTTGEVYTADHYANQISKFLMDESEWEAWKGPEPGNGALSLSVPRGVSFDQVSKEIYTADMDHNRIVKTKMDDSNMWENYGSFGSGVGQFNHPMNIHYDLTTEYIYVSDDANPRIVRFKMNGGDPQWQSLDTSEYYDWGLDFTVQDGTDFVYFNDYVNQRVVKVKMDGTEKSYIDPLFWDVASELAYGATPVYFDASSESLFFTNARNIYRTDMSGNLIEKVTGTPNKVLFTTSGSKPMEIGISAYSGKFSLTLNSYELPISNSEVQTLTSGSWHSIQISFDRTTGTMNAYLDGNTTPFISRSGMSSQLLKSMSDVGEYFYIGSDPTDPNRTFPGAIDDVAFGLPDPVSPSPTASSTSTTTPKLLVLPETGKKR